MNDTATRAELEKLARILGTDTETVQFLAPIDATDLRTLREGVTDAMFARFRDSFRSFARLSGIMPMAISARIAQHVLGPTLAARIAGEMPPDKAIELSARLPDSFLADTCLQLDPHRADAIIAGFPIDRAVILTRVLLARNETIVMGHFVDVLPTETLLAAADAIEDEADLLHISFFVEDNDQLDRVVAHLTPERRRGLIRAAAARDQWPEIITTLQRISPGSRAALARSALAEDNATLDSLIRAAALRDLWPALLGVGQNLEHATRARLLQQAAFNDPAVVRSALDSIAANDLWPAFAAQFEALGERGTARLLQIATRQRPEFLARLGRQMDTANENAVNNLRAAGGLLGTNLRQRVLAACDGTPLARMLAQPPAGTTDS